MNRLPPLFFITPHSNMETKMPKPSYVCECAEYFNRDTEISEGCFECIPCAAWAGTCESVCDCGQCLYTDTPCTVKSSEKPCDCKFCELRAEWQEQFDAQDWLSDLRSILSDVELRVAEVKEQLAKPWQLGMVSHDYTQKRLDYRLAPCLEALRLVGEKSAWASAVIDEVKNLLNMDGREGLRNICGIPDCTCHLRILSALVAEKKGPEMKAIEIEIALAEDARHAHWRASVEAMRAWDATKFELRIAQEMLEEAKWDTGMINTSEWDAEMKTLEAALEEARTKATAAGEAYKAVGLTTAKPAEEFHRLVEMKKVLNAA